MYVNVKSFVSNLLIFINSFSVNLYKILLLVLDVSKHRTCRQHKIESKKNNNVNKMLFKYIS